MATDRASGRSRAGVPSSSQRRRANHQPPAVAGLRMLQRSAGNAAVAQLLSGRPAPPGIGGALPVQRQKVISDRVTKTEELGERRRSVVVATAEGHASPRWLSARGDRDADRRNLRLSRNRALNVRDIFEALLRNRLSDRELVVAYDQSTRNPTKQPADLIASAIAKGSRVTLREAGRLGRQADDEAMRRVVLTIERHDRTETDQFLTHAQVVREPSPSTSWEVNVTGDGGGGAIGYAGAVIMQLRNRQNRQVGTYAGYQAGMGAGGGVGASGDWHRFSTRQPHSFADFHAGSFKIRQVQLALGIGLGYTKLKIKPLNGAWSKWIDLSGITLGGVGASAKIVTGNIFLTNSPRETKNNQRTAYSHRTDTNDHLDRWSLVITFANRSPDVDGNGEAALKRAANRAGAQFA